MKRFQGFRKFRGFATGLLAGCLLMAAAPVMADTIKQYVLVKAAYPIQVNGTIYGNEALPVLNYEGSTYIPLRATGDLLGATVAWNPELKRAEIAYGDAKANAAFRHIQVSGSNGHYRVTGEARVFEATMNYAVGDGHRYLIEDFHTVSEGAPAWSKFELNLDIPAAQVPQNGALVLELFEYSAKDGSRINNLDILLETFRP